MRSFALIAAAASVVAATGDWSKHGDSWGPKGTGAPVYVTDVVTAYTTYCPEATKLTHNGVTYTVTSATTLTISNCPCTVTRPVESAKPTSSAAGVPPPPPSSKAPVASTGAPAPPKPSSYFPSVASPSSPSAVTSAPVASYTGAAGKVQVAGAGLLAVLGAAAVAL